MKNIIYVTLLGTALALSTSAWAAHGGSHASAAGTHAVAGDRTSSTNTSSDTSATTSNAGTDSSIMNAGDKMQVLYPTS